MCPQFSGLSSTGTWLCVFTLLWRSQWRDGRPLWRKLTPYMARSTSNPKINTYNLVNLKHKRHYVSSFDSLKMLNGRCDDFSWHFSSPFWDQYDARLRCFWWPVQIWMPVLEVQAKFEFITQTSWNLTNSGNFNVWVYLFVWGFLWGVLGKKKVSKLDNGQSNSGWQWLKYLSLKMFKWYKDYVLKLPLL